MKYIINIMYICTLKQKSIFIVFLCLLLLILNTCENPFMVKLLEPLTPQKGQDNTIYTITFNANGGKGTIQSIAVKAGESITMPNGSGLSKEGYLFSGWNADANGTGITYTTGSTYTPVSSITFYSVWVDAISAITITFDANGGSGTVQPIMAYAGEDITLPNGNGLSKEGYLFSGWNINANGTGITYTAGSTYTPVGSITLYAVWVDAILAITITFDANGGSGTVQPIMVNAGRDIILPNGSGLYRMGYIFKGWNTNANGTGVTYNKSIIYTPISNITFYAVWINCFANAAELGIYLDSMPANTPDDPYTIVLNDITNIRDTLQNRQDKYVSLDLSGSVIKTIPREAFYECTSLNSVTIPNSVTSIGDYAFYECTSLNSVIIPDSVTSIGVGAFNGCTKLTSVTIPDSVTSIGIYAFYNCTSLTSVTIPDSVTIIGGGTFCRCTSLTSVTIPDSVTSIGDDAFNGCTNLTSVTIPDSVTSIGGRAFSNCRLTSITIPNSITEIGKLAFYVCPLTSVTIPDSVTSIGDGAFSNCGGLTAINVANNNNKYTAENGVLYNKNRTILHTYPAAKTNSFFTIPNSVTSIGDSAFYGCENLTSVTIPDGVTSIGDAAFLGCRRLTSVTIPDSVTSIGDSAFLSCDKLTSVTIPNSVTSIGSSAFCNCTSLTSITIPDSVTSIGKQAFYVCRRLTSVNFEGTISAENFSSDNSFPGDLHDKYFAVGGGIGTYTRANSSSATWEKSEE